MKCVGMPICDQPREDMLRNAVVDHALAGNRALFLSVEGGGIVLEILDQSAGFGAFVKDLGLAFVDFAAAGHKRTYSAGTRFPRVNDHEPQHCRGI